MKRTFTAVLAGLLAGAALGIVSGGPAGAGATSCVGNASNAPDGRIREVGSDWTGGNGDYAFSFVDVVLGVGEVAQYELQWRNVGPDNLTVRVKLAEYKKVGYGVKFSLGDQNLKPLLVRDGKAVAFPHLAPGTRTGKIRVEIRNKSATTTSAEVVLRGFYGGSPSPTTMCDALQASAND